jgi:hemoglobin
MPPAPPVDATGPGLAPPLSSTAAKSPAPATPDTLWKRLGGEENVAKIVDDLITYTLYDKTINLSRGGRYKLDTKEKVEDLKQKLVGYIGYLSDGNVPYAGKGMAEAHRGMNIQGKEFDAFVESLRLALKNNGVAAKDVDELIAKVKAARKDIVADK